MPAPLDCVTAIAFPWSNTKTLADSLKNGDLCLSTAIGQFNAVIRETLKVFEEYSRDQTKSNIEFKNKVEKMDKLIGDLSEKCQGMQQALLYKEEKYDEKCREAERYKVICELSAKAAVSDDIQYTQREENNNDNHYLMNSQNRDDHQPQEQPKNSPVSSKHFKSVKTHTKLDLTQARISDYMEPLQTERRESCSRLDDNQSLRSEMASQYVGGSCKRKAPSSIGSSDSKRNIFQERLSMMGGMNVQGPRVNPGPVPLTKLYQHDEFFPTNQNKRVKIALMGQSSEIMSSSENAVNQMKQTFTEKNLHKQVAGGSWTRMSSRKRKGWPF